MSNNTSALVIFIALSLVAGVVYASGVDTDSDRTLRRDTGSAYVYGNPDATTTIVEFSDYECPFCSRLHPTLKRIVDESEGRVNWEYRHLPLPKHRRAEYAAAVGECIGMHRGNEAFWSYTDTVLASQNVDRDYLVTLATQYDFTETELATCTQSDEVQERIAADLAAARAYGGDGTPYSIVTYEDGTLYPVTGALPYEQWVRVVTNKTHE